MRHAYKHNKLGKDAKHRKAMLRNLSLSFLSRESIRTTEAKAKQLRSFVEKLITKAKKDTLANRRLVYRDIRNTNTLQKLFNDIAKRFAERPGGYTRIIKLGMRKGDASQECLIKLVSTITEDAPLEEKSSSLKKKKEKKDTTKKETKKDSPIKTEEAKRTVSAV